MIKNHCKNKMKIEILDYNLEKTIDDENTDYISERHCYNKEWKGSITVEINGKKFSCKVTFCDFSTGDNGSKSANVFLNNMKFNQFNSDELTEIELTLTEYIEEEYRKNGRSWED